MRVVVNRVPDTVSINKIAPSTKALRDFIRLDPRQHKQIAELMCSLYEQLGKQSLEVLSKFTSSLVTGDKSEFMEYLSSYELPLSTISELLALSQELEAATRDKVDELILMAKRGVIELTKTAFSRATRE